MFRTLIAAALFLPGMAFAQPQLVSSSPAKNASVTRPTKISLGFSEKVQGQSSGFDLVMTGMPGMADHQPMPIKGFTTSVGADGKTLVATLPRALPAGSYDLNWHVVGADKESAAGSFAFRVK